VLSARFLGTAPSYTVVVAIPLPWA